MLCRVGADFFSPGVQRRGSGVLNRKEGGEWEEFGEENWGSREVVFEEEWGFALNSEKKGEKPPLRGQEKGVRNPKCVL